MGVVTNIIDALRRIGSPTQKAALKRQDAQLEGKEVLGRRREIVDGELGRTSVLVATIAPVEETVAVLSEDELRPIIENVVYGDKFDKLGFTNEAVMELLGAMFGYYCSVQLNMRWIKLSDATEPRLQSKVLIGSLGDFPFGRSPKGSRTLNMGSSCRSLH